MNDLLNFRQDYYSGGDFATFLRRNGRLSDYDLLLYGGELVCAFCVVFMSLFLI